MTVTKWFPSPCWRYRQCWEISYQWYMYNSGEWRYKKYHLSKENHGRCISIVTIDIFRPSR